jgi:hypothetical protein
MIQWENGLGIGTADVHVDMFGTADAAIARILQRRLRRNIAN